MTAQQAAARLQRMQQRLRDAVVRAEAQTADDARSQARMLSAGPFTPRDLRGMGHPYAKRDPRPPFDPAVINMAREGEGGFEQQWKIRPPAWNAGGLHTEVRNDSPEAVFLDRGTRYMIRRPLVERVLMRTAIKRRARLVVAIRRALTS